MPTRNFDGSPTGPKSQWLTTPASSAYDNLATFTLCAWVKPRRTVTSAFDFGMVVAMKGLNLATANFGPALIIISNTTSDPTRGNQIEGQIIFSTRSAWSWSNQPGGMCPAGQWTHLAMTYDGSLIRLYANGVETTVYTQQRTGLGVRHNDSIGGFAIGNDNLDLGVSGYGDATDGQLADLRVYNAVLSAAELLNISRYGVDPRPANNVGWWWMNGFSPEADSSGRGNQATVVRATISPETPPTATGQSFLGSVRVVATPPAGLERRYAGRVILVPASPTIMPAPPYLGQITLGTPSAGATDPLLGAVVVVGAAPAGAADPYLGDVTEL